MSISILNIGDQLCIALRDIAEGEELAKGLHASEPLPKGHKIARCSFAIHEVIHKFDHPIGVATQPIEPGQWVHDHNLAYSQDLIQSSAARRGRSDMIVPERQTFMGFKRANGRAGTRNFIGVIASVNCSATVCQSVVQKAERELQHKYPHIDGFVAITHDSGCGMADSGEPFELLQRTLQGYIDHPNFVGTILIGLGCEVNQIKNYSSFGETSTNRTNLSIQESGGSLSAVEEALKRLEEICRNVEEESQRTEVSVSHLCVGLECGGSDGLSGITANPALGKAVDLLVQAGGTAVLSETPEIYGAESLLLNRTDSSIASKLEACIDWWKSHAEHQSVSLDNNPSPGNKAGGLTTILEKSLGAVSKAGSSDLKAFYKYAEPITQQGLVFMDTPGYDPAAATGQIAGGANLIAFTTGRGSCFGSRPAPCLKLASNSPLYQRMEGDMDINCGRILDSDISLDEMGLEIYEALIDMASGKYSKSEQLGYGNNEFVPWRFGAML